MLIKFDYLVRKYCNSNIKGILHIGAHECEEIRAYEKIISRNKILWIEAIPEKVTLCKQRYNNILIEQAVVSDVVENVTFNVSNNGQSSSILELGLHTLYHPNVHYINSYNVTTKILRDILPKYNIPFNFINLDIQGAELKALKGMSEYLSNVDYIYTEVNDDYVYKGCNLIGEIDEFLKEYNFERVETKMTAFKWGDAFYVKKKV